jgi:serine protease
MLIERSHRVRIGAVVVVVLGVCLGNSAVPATAKQSESQRGPTTNQVIVKLRGDAAARMDAGQQRAAVASVAARAGHSLEYRFDHGGGVHTLRLSGEAPESDVQSVAAELARDLRVAYAEPDWIMRHTASTPNDSSFGQQWSLQAVSPSNFGIDAPRAWDIERGDAGIVVAVIDTGYRPHADLAGRFVPGYDFVDYDFGTAALSANDGDGRDADAQDPGDWITAMEDASGYFSGCGASPSSWHGTHVAGIIGAATNNGVGVAGVNWGSKILPVRVLGKCGGFTSDIVDGMRWAAGLPVPGAPANPNPAHVLNLSLGGSSSCSATYQNAIDEITAAGVAVVVAAGNSNGPVGSPANCSGVIAVAATSRSGNRAFYSNFGSAVSVAAPGGNSSTDTKILSTLNAGLTTPGADSYAAYQGTSMAAPHVAGVASLVLSVNPCLTPSQVNTLLRSTVTNFPAGSSCTTTTCGVGIVNAGAAVEAAKASKTLAPAAATSASLRPALPASPFQVRVPVLFRDKFWVPCL